MNLAAGQFYTSGTFWAIVGVAAVLLIGIATIWATLRVANPKRRLYYSMPSDTPLITGQQDLSQELKVIYGTRKLDSPRIINIEVISRGRRDIPRDAFDGNPVCLDLGTPILECVKVATSPPDRPDPSYALNGSKLMIGPSLLGRRQTTVFSLLIDGKSPEIAKPQQTMVDVEIRQGEPQRAVPVSLFANFLLTIIIGTVVWGLLVARTAHHATLSASEQAVAIALPLVFLAILAGAFFLSRLFR